MFLTIHMTASPAQTCKGRNTRSPFTNETKHFPNPSLAHCCTIFLKSSGYRNRWSTQKSKYPYQRDHLVGQSTSVLGVVTTLWLCRHLNILPRTWISIAVVRLQQTKTESSGARATGARPGKVFVTETMLLACTHSLDHIIRNASPPDQFCGGWQQLRHCHGQCTQPLQWEGIEIYRSTLAALSIAMLQISV